ncbi:LysR family transcriptional regulator [Pseudomonas sp. N3-W]|jgi:DNA-binding transcriptional LysR family regulator|uniref:LysR family transcriptional regulator n=1 Tax=Pseudomonas fungipugnans TaxID=3024217 RepID=A0ABT6QRY5_9PSED|nr:MULTISPECIES: LysR family transcriptional regulator [unclassified Pseudomonas]MDI2593662.1 LysR family transcriptional regulator [Pseudomonas sp. 681]UWF50093.1 LysR family transcriptional regulator [Pseudomonas sp. N3-W]
MLFNEENFADIDLNLIIIFLVLFRERSVSRTAERLHVKQPAISGSLARLRKRFDDPLFLRAANTMRPTSKAEELAQALSPAIRQIEAVISL